MVDERLEDGRRIAELLSSELSGQSDGVLDRVSVRNADREVTGSPDGQRAYDVADDAGVLGSVYVHESRARLTVGSGTELALSAADETGLRTRSTPTGQVHVFVESGAAVKRAVSVVEAVVADRDH